MRENFDVDEFQMVKVETPQPTAIRQPQENETCGFGIGGVVVETTSSKCLCKVGDLDGKKFYYARTDGSNLYDPWGMYSEGNTTRFDKQKGHDLYPFVRVSELVFNQYLAYISTRNRAHLLNAQRVLR